MALEATIDPIFKLRPEDRTKGQISYFLSNLTDLHQHFLSAPLSAKPTALIPQAHFEEKVVINYEFVITRRFWMDGELYVGGNDGEVLNVDTFIGEQEYRLKEVLREITS